jgi:hypothetical protein
MNWFKIEDWSTPKLLLIVAAIILLTPLIYTLLEIPSKLTTSFQGKVTTQS